MQADHERKLAEIWHHFEHSKFVDVFHLLKQAAEDILFGISMTILPAGKLELKDRERWSQREDVQYMDSNGI